MKEKKDRKMQCGEAKEKVQVVEVEFQNLID
jgi:hypothetical protein